MSESQSTVLTVDSTSGLPDDYLQRHGISAVSLYVTLDGDQQRETEIPDLREFYERMKASSQGATTSQPSVGDFIEVWGPLLDAGREIVSVHLASGISGTCESAIAARERLSEEGRGGERIEVVDTGTGAGGTGLCAIAAAAEIERGGDRASARARCEQAAAGIDIRFAVDTLEYLRRGGRIGGAQAFLGTALKIKPILTFSNEVEPVTKVRTRARSLAHLRSYAAERAAEAPQAWCVQHVDDPESAEKLAGELREVFGRDPEFVTELRPVLGAHSGPGMVGVGTLPAASLG